MRNRKPKTANTNIATKDFPSITGEDVLHLEAASPAANDSRPANARATRGVRKGSAAASGSSDEHTFNTNDSLDASEIVGAIEVVPDVLTHASALLANPNATLSSLRLVKIVCGAGIASQRGVIVIGLAGYHVWKKAGAMSGGAGQKAGPFDGKQGALNKLARICSKRMVKAGSKEISGLTLRAYVDAIRLVYVPCRQVLVRNNVPDPDTWLRTRLEYVPFEFLKKLAAAKKHLSGNKLYQAIELAYTKRREAPKRYTTSVFAADLKKLIGPATKQSGAKSSKGAAAASSRLAPTVAGDQSAFKSSAGFADKNLLAGGLPPAIVDVARKSGISVRIACRVVGEYFRTQSDVIMALVDENELDMRINE